MKRLLSIVLCFIVLLSFPIQTQAASVTAYRSSFDFGNRKIPKIKLGSNKVTIKPGAKNLMVYHNVKFIAPKDGEYTVKLSGLKCSGVSAPFVSMQAVMAESDTRTSTSYNSFARRSVELVAKSWYNKVYSKKDNPGLDYVVKSTIELKKGQCLVLNFVNPSQITGTNTSYNERITKDLIPGAGSFNYKPVKSNMVFDLLIKHK